MLPHPTARNAAMSMAFEDVTTYASHYAPSTASSSTAYQGSQGQIDTDSVPKIALDEGAFEDIHLTTRSRDPSPLRSGIGSRLLSTLSNAQPAAAALSRSGSVIHSRAKSWAALVPKLNPTNNTPSPDRIPGEVHYQQPNRIFGDLFNGESAPIRLGIPTSPVKERDEIEFVMEYRPTFTERPQRPHGRRRNAGQSDSPTNTRTSWFGRKTSLASPPAPASKSDDLSNLDIHAALFPHGPADPLSPHAFNDLLLNATSLLQRLQTAYKEKVDFIASMQPEMDAQREEVEEAETRSRHLKMQLEDLSRQAQEQLQINRDLTESLMQEKTKARTVRVVRAPSERDIDERDEEHDEDEDNTPRRRKRGSAASASDSGFESDADSSSLFSAGVETPPISLHRLPRTPEYESAAWPNFKLVGPRDRPASGLSRTISRSPLSSVVAAGKYGAGDDASGWATVEKLRGENNSLRSQMDDMQRTLQGCIDFVGTVCNP